MKDRIDVQKRKMLNNVESQALTIRITSPLASQTSSLKTKDQSSKNQISNDFTKSSSDKRLINDIQKQMVPPIKGFGLIAKNFQTEEKKQAASSRITAGVSNRQSQQIKRGLLSPRTIDSSAKGTQNA